MSLSTILALAWLALAAPQSGPDNQPAEPFRIADNLYYVGASDIASYLIVTPDGLILVDAGYDTTAPLILRNIARLGFKPRDVRILLSTQAHFDHAGGFAEMKRATGARLAVIGADGDLIEHGGRGDYLFGNRHTFPAAHVDRRLRDGETVTLGGTSLVAHLTPGHTKGCTTWSFDAPDRGRMVHVVIVGGASINPGTHVSGMETYPQIARDYAHTFEVLKALPCDIFLGAHASYYGGMEKAAKLKPDAGDATSRNPFVDPDGYRAFIERSERVYRDQLAKEKG